MSSAPKPSPPRRKKPPSGPASRQHKRGDVWLVKSDPEHPSIGTEMWADRPALVISSDVMNRASGYAVVVYLTTSPRKRSGPTNIVLPAFSDDARAQDGTIALCGQVHTVDASRLAKRLGAYDERAMVDVDAGVSISLAIGKHGAPPTAALFHKWERMIQEHGIDVAAEVRALAGETADQRVESLQKALDLALVQRDSWRMLYETRDAGPEDMLLAAGPEDMLLAAGA